MVCRDPVAVESVTYCESHMIECRERQRRPRKIKSNFLERAKLQTLITKYRGNVSHMAIHLSVEGRSITHQGVADLLRRHGLEPDAAACRATARSRPGPNRETAPGTRGGQLEKSLIVKTLRLCRTQREAATKLDLSPSSFQRRLVKHGIEAGKYLLVGLAIRIKVR